VKSFLDEFSSGVSVRCNKGNQAPFLTGPPLARVTGALPPALCSHATG